MEFSKCSIESLLAHAGSYLQTRLVVAIRRGIAIRWLDFEVLDGVSFSQAGRYLQRRLV
ncbi:hypothetical protein T12_14887 [Trichinella patagoniensis]|uniref:Uncharacterized protein n=1 Tax=Trichinella patagoniensis TaxID=990121 RepID=A0A0V0YZB8_9BILA|nr:hypothetical protein T12_14887 [Trichinella patagoniensis]